MSRKIVLIRGKKRAGKDTTAKILEECFEENDNTVEIMSFAEPMKDIIATTFGISLKELDSLKNDNTKELCIAQDYLGNDDWEFEPLPFEEDKVATSLRAILQRFGTEAMKKHFGDYVWTDLMHKRILKCKADIVIIPDWRFPIEHDYLVGHGRKIQTIEVVNNRVQSDDTHSSETALDGFQCDFIVENHGTLEELEKQIKG